MRIDLGKDTSYSARELRSLIIAALGSLGPRAKDSVPLLKAELEDDDQLIRLVAADTLEGIGEQ